MISDVYLLVYTITRKYREKQLLHDYLLEVAPKCLNDHLSKDLKLLSIDYKKDVIVDAILCTVLPEVIMDPIDQLYSDFIIESGYFQIKLEGQDKVDRKYEVIEFVFSQLCESNPFLVALLYSLVDGELKLFGHLLPFHREDDCPKDLNHFSPFLEAYFQNGVIPDNYVSEIAKLMLVSEAG